MSKKIKIEIHLKQRWVGTARGVGNRKCRKFQGVKVNIKVFGPDIGVLSGVRCISGIWISGYLALQF
uniref:Uncharacterized protein n=1 Tax=Meloidogyne enterolobii TaxID=390850 RepID=A0A6V7W6B3_MELEN|nr:unnamed protein product [Meloidogyne enterolobii]